MTSSTKPALDTPTSLPSSPASGRQRQQFVALALTMSWQLALAVLVPVLAGVGLGKKYGSENVWVLVALLVALVATAVVLRRTLQAANRLPVPKLSAAQKRAIRKSYDEDDA